MQYLLLIPFILILVICGNDIKKLIYAIVLTELVMASSDLFFGVSPRYLFVPYAVILCALGYSTLKERVKQMDKGSRGIFILASGYLFWVLIAHGFIQGFSFFEYDFIRYIARTGMYITTAFLIQLYMRDEKDLKKLIYFIIIICGISGLVGVLQIMSVEWAVGLRNFFQKPIPVGVKPTSRAFGLQYYHIDFAYDMLMGLFLFFSAKISITKGKRNNYWLYVSAVFIVLGLIFSQARSALGGALAGMFAMAVMFRKKRIVIAAAAGVFLILAFARYGNMITGDRVKFSRMTTLESSARLRKPLFQVGSRILVNNPFGIGNGRFKEHVKENLNSYSDIPGASSARKHGVHNHFLMIGISYGWPALIFLLIFMVKLTYVLLKTYSKNYSNYTRVLSLCLAGYFVSYLINIFFHHGGFFKGDATIWIIIGILLAMNNKVPDSKNG